MIIFTQEERKSAPGFPTSHFHLPCHGKKSNLVIIEAKTKSIVQSFCVILNLSSLEPKPSAVGPRGLLDPHGCYGENT